VIYKELERKDFIVINSVRDMQLVEKLTQHPLVLFYEFVESIETNRIDNIYILSMIILRSFSKSVFRTSSARSRCTASSILLMSRPPLALLEWTEVRMLENSNWRGQHQHGLGKHEWISPVNKHGSNL
jgi:hypothetical protein